MAHRSADEVKKKIRDFVLDIGWTMWGSPLYPTTRTHAARGIKEDV